MTVHFVYPHGPSISTPDSIGRNVGARLRSRYDVVHHDWDSTDVIVPKPGDVLLGHPHPSPGTIFRRSMRRGGWRRVVAFLPWVHGDLSQCAWVDPLIPRCDLFLAITGNYWFGTLEGSAFAHLAPKMRHVDLAVDRDEFPPIKAAFNAPGQRRFVYIGSRLWYKNTGYLTALARALPGVEISWMGSAREPIEGLRSLGHVNFRTDEGKDAIRRHDFLVTTGSADANPTTILEAMAWGLIPVVTPESGYVGFPGIVNVPLDDVPRATAILEELQALPSEELAPMQQLNWELLDRHFNWDRVGEQVLAAIDSDHAPPTAPEPLGRKAALRWAALKSPYAWWRPRSVVRLARSWRRRRA